MTTPSPGSRVRAVHFHITHPGPAGDDGLVRDPSGHVLGVDDNVSVPPGTLGTVDSLDAGGTIHVDWDNGVRLGLLPELDRWEQVTPRNGEGR